MFYCFIHNWYSSEEPCPVCHPKVTATTTNFILNETPNDEQPKEELISAVVNRGRDYITYGGRQNWHYSFNSFQNISNEKLLQIKESIENILNYNATKPDVVDEQPKETEEDIYKRRLEEIQAADKINFANQPLSGEFITKEECERREKLAFDKANFYQTFEDYKQSTKQ